MFFFTRNNVTNTIHATHYVRDRLRQGLHTFIHHESFGGILLFFSVILAMIIANSSYSNWYFKFLEASFGGFIGQWSFKMNVLHFTNAVLMSLFFLMVGLEMKREVLYGELAGFKKINFSLLGALGGMILPILIYLYFNYNTTSANGFGVAMSTDTAFALGVLLLFGKRIPPALKIFLVTLAVFDDLGAILVIAILYTETLNLFWIYSAGVITCILIAINYYDIKYTSAYIFLGILLWVAFYNSGVHATIAGVLLALTIPGRSDIRKKYFIQILDVLEEWSAIADNIKEDCQQSKQPKKNFFTSFRENIASIFTHDKEQKIDMQIANKHVQILDKLTKYSHYAQNPLVKIEVFLQPICAYFIVPIFAFLNAGIPLHSDINFNIDGLFMGTLLGLLVGKPLGVITFAYLGEKLAIATRPAKLNYMHILAIGMIAGIGFTISMFVANLAYATHEQIMLAKLSILIASLIATILGVILLFFITRPKISTSTPNQ
ncbi:MAG: Na+/H+ antiporter NhaA [Helicobacter sp.]|nr:Na+/H+ antiporter NhaA [Helicobacter sp.]